MAGDDKVIKLLDHRDHSSTDAASSARLQMVNARQAAGLSQQEFSDAIAKHLSWKPTPELVEAWESKVVPPGDVLVAAQTIAAQTVAVAGADGLTIIETAPEATDTKLAGIDSAFASRSDFVAKVPIDNLFDAARKIEASGISLNLVVQQYPSKRLVQQLNQGTEVDLFFLRPHGWAIGQREKEEGYNNGDLSSLTAMNIAILNDRVKTELDSKSTSRLHIGTYDETVRFNMIFIDETFCIFQPYLHAERGIENPTLVVHRQDGGVFDVLRHSFEWIKAQATTDA